MLLLLYYTCVDCYSYLSLPSYKGRSVQKHKFLNLFLDKFPVFEIQLFY